RATAGRTEMVLDRMAVERVGGQRRLRRLQSELPARHEPEQIALAAAMRAIAFHHFVELALHFEADLPAMAAALMAHRCIPCVVARRRRRVERLVGVYSA